MIAERFQKAAEGAFFCPVTKMLKALSNGGLFLFQPPPTLTNPSGKVLMRPWPRYNIRIDNLVRVEPYALLQVLGAFRDDGGPFGDRPLLPKRR